MTYQDQKCDKRSALPFYDPGWSDRQFSCSIIEAEQYQQQLDNHSPTYEDDEDSDSHIPTEEDSRGHIFDDCGFFIKLVRTCRSDCSPQVQGLHRIMYLRFHHEEMDPIDEVYTFIEVSSRPGSIALHRWNIFGRQSAPMANMELAKSWLQSCVRSHKDCQNATPAQMPSRIVDLRPPFSGSNLDLRLIANPDNRGPYVTLSHCWGSSQPLKLLKGNYEAFQNRILYNSLPKTFQDAVTVTRALGIRYLWIDSLCIIQDSKQDWEIQCKKMQRIYKDSFVTVAGPSAAGCDSGFLHPRPHICEVTLPISCGDISDELIFWYRGIDEDPMTLAPEENAPLSTRAWVLQERLLSTRVLYFGTKVQYMECLTDVLFENFHFPIHWDYTEIDMISKPEMKVLWSGSDFLEHWTTLAITYSRLNLTKITDRFPALSGLVSSVQASQYLAGIWSHDLPGGLTWYVAPWDREKPISPVNSPAEYVAPSWSWAAVKFGVCFPIISYRTEFHHDFDIVDAAVRPAGLDPFGTIENGYIEGSGRMRRFLVQKRPDLNVPGRHSIYVLSHGPDSPISALFAPDYYRTEEFQESTVVLLYLGMFTDGESVAMSVERIEGVDSTFKRTGLAFTHYATIDNGTEYRFPELFKKIEKRKVRLV
ncbi:heterokaryon incompatibility protein [Fusarium langsethiae]|uniref:Heterokaryon incompatibility protein n=1 Tax=Fusarium langsethiae TaxID=179993 RepID=A0A0M9ES20_FUSLA|nr:heterokaryon incompatibility protein [Fusarium langsethiae]